MNIAEHPHAAVGGRWSAVWVILMLGCAVFSGNLGGGGKVHAPDKAMPCSDFDDYSWFFAAAFFYGLTDVTLQSLSGAICPSPRRPVTSSPSSSSSSCTSSV